MLIINKCIYLLGRLNCNENTIKEIWQNSKHKGFMDMFLTNPPDICAVCSHYNNVSVLANDHHRELLKKQKEIYN